MLFDDPRLTTMGLLVETSEGVLAKVGEQLSTVGLDVAEFGVLVRLARSPQHQLRMSDLAAQTTLSTSGITRVVDRLERDGLVERVVCSSDRRGYHATLTDAGTERLGEALPGHLQVIDQWLTGVLSAAELHGFSRALRQVRDGVRPEATAGAEGVSGSAVGRPEVVPAPEVVPGPEAVPGPEVVPAPEVVAVPRSA